MKNTPPATEAPPVCSRVAIYADKLGNTIEIPLPDGMLAQEWLQRKGVTWHRQTTLELHTGETTDAALARHIAATQAQLQALVADAL